YGYGWDVIYDFNTLDSVDVLGSYQSFKLSNTCKYFTDKIADSFKGVEIRDFNTKQLLFTLPINGYTLTGMEFSPDDKYLVTSCGHFDSWKISTGEKVNEIYHGTIANFSISHNDKYIVETGGRYIFLLTNNFYGTNSVKSNLSESTLIFPNPPTGNITINIKIKNQSTSFINLTTIDGLIIRNLVNKIIPIGQNSLQFNVSDLANGTYFIVIRNGKETQSYKLIINK
ncbi:MAG: T9SS type A sorting domain-containing protein, partial [Candidatus Kapabacteria bacterium]|nr:T9SS type A sorting domain-containing protein [Candidatus Kapabacteria bacterium]